MIVYEGSGDEILIPMESYHPRQEVLFINNHCII